MSKKSFKLRYQRLVVLAVVGFIFLMLSSSAPSHAQVTGDDLTVQLSRSSGGGGSSRSWKVSEVARSFIKNGYRAVITYQYALEIGFRSGSTNYKRVRPSEVALVKDGDREDRAVHLGWLMPSNPGMQWSTTVESDQVEFLWNTQVSQQRARQIAYAQNRSLASKLEISVLVSPKEEDYITETLMKEFQTIVETLQAQMGGPPVVSTPKIPLVRPDDPLLAEAYDLMISNGGWGKNRREIGLIFTKALHGVFSKEYIDTLVRLRMSLVTDKLRKIGREVKLGLAAVKRKFGADFVIVKASDGVFCFRTEGELEPGDQIVPNSTQLSVTQFQELAKSAGLSYKQLGYLLGAFRGYSWLKRQ